MMRRNGENGSGNGNGSSSQGLMSKLHQCEIHMKFRGGRGGGIKRQNFLQVRPPTFFLFIPFILKWIIAWRGELPYFDI